MLPGAKPRPWDGRGERGVTAALPSAGIFDEIDIVGEVSSTAPHCWHPSAGQTFCAPQNLQRITIPPGKTEAWIRPILRLRTVACKAFGPPGIPHLRFNLGLNYAGMISLETSPSV